MSINGRKLHESRGLYVAQVAWNTFSVYKRFGKRYMHTSNVYATDMDTAKAIIDRNYDRMSWQLQKGV